MLVNWNSFKTQIISQNLPIQSVESDDSYHLSASNGAECILIKSLNTEEISDFLTNYQTNVGLIQYESIALTPKNNHSLQPWGAKKGKFTSSDRACVITLSNKSQDGLTFTYSSSLTPRVGDYIFQDDFCKRSWIVSVDTQNSTVTMDNETVKPTLDNGTGVYVQGYWLGVDIPDWFNPMYIWGVTINFYWDKLYASATHNTVTFTAITSGTIGNLISLTFNGLTDTVGNIVKTWNEKNPTNLVKFSGQAGTYIPSAGTVSLSGGHDGHDGKNDFIELSIVDSNDYFKDDTFCQQFFGVADAQAAIPYIQALGFEDNGEYGHWTKYYDESWVCNVNNKIIMTPDGAPGEIMSHLETRVSVFTSKTDSTLTECFLDYLPTAKE